MEKGSGIGFDPTTGEILVARSPEAPPDPDAVRSFSQFIAVLEDGTTHHILTGEVRKILGALNEHAIEAGGKAKGELTLKLEFEQIGGSIEITPQVTTKLPKSKHVRTVFYTTPDGDLTRRNPKQRELFARDAAYPAGTPRTV